MNKIWILKFFIFSFLFIVIGGFVNFIFDPLQQYRQAKFYKPYYSNERYMNPGIAKNYHYNSVVIGSSMVENFRLSNVENILGFKDPIKLSVAGASAYELKLTMDIVNKTHKVKDVLYGFDIYSFYGDIDRTSYPLPMYLYDNNIFNDFQYIFSLDTTKEVMKVIVAQKLKKNDPKMNINTMYQWQHMFEDSFGIQKVLKEFESIDKNFNISFNNKEYTYEKFVNSFQNNFIPLVKNFPKTNFYVFYPPYSILAYKNMQNKNWLHDFLKFRKYVYMVSKSYSNVKIYDFQVADKIICNLNNYKDITHYHQDINFWILQQIREGNYMVGSIDTIESNNRKIQEDVQDSIVPYLIGDNK